jgi:hypothetical protein
MDLMELQKMAGGNYFSAKVETGGVAHFYFPPDVSTEKAKRAVEAALDAAYGPIEYREPMGLCGAVKSWWNR